jgi:hypothetical protein
MSGFQNQKDSSSAEDKDWREDCKKPPKDTRIQTEVSFTKIT